MIEINKTYNIDALKGLQMLPEESVNCIVTSPPYWLQRNYGVEGQIGMEKHFTEFIENLCNIFNEAYRVLKPSGTIWVNMGDTYHNPTKWTNKKESPQTISGGNNRNFNPIRRKDQGIKSKSLCMIPDRFAIEMISRGWILRNQIIWHKPNAMPESVKDRFTIDFEKIYFFTKNTKYYFEQQLEIAAYDGRKDTIMKGSKKYSTPGITGQSVHTIAARGHERWPYQIDGKPARNKRSVWLVPTKALKEAHFAAYPEALITPCILAGCPEGGIVLDPFHGSGTTGRVANKNSRNYIGFELNPEYIAIEEKLK